MLFLNDKSPKSLSENVGKNREGLSLLARMIWMLVGNVAIVFCLLSIANPRPDFFSTADVVLPIAVIVAIAARFIDIKHLGGTTGSGTPATMRDFIKYLLLLCGISGALWGIAHVVSIVGRK